MSEQDGDGDARVGGGSAWDDARHGLALPPGCRVDLDVGRSIAVGLALAVGFGMCVPWPSMDSYVAGYPLPYYDDFGGPWMLVPFAIDVVLWGGAVHLGRRWLARAEARGLGEVLARKVHHAAVIGAALAALVLVAIGLSDLRPVDPTAAIYAAWGGTTGIAICATLIAVVDLHLGWAHGSSRAALALGWIRIAVCFVAFVAVAFTWRVCVQSVFIYEIF